jgi:DNA polymerase-3 subunit epsilon/CBS domain-containing protein
MDRLGFRHLPVRNAQGEIVGMVTPRNLLRQRASSAIVLGDEIDSAADTIALGRAWARLPIMARSLLEEAVDARTIAAVISSEMCALTRRAAEIAEARLGEAGWGPPPVPYCVLVLGSAGRGESLLAADQDNAIVFEHGPPGGPEDRWFAEFGSAMNEILDEVGVPYCRGGVMAKTPAWRHSLADWKGVVDGWVRRQRMEDLLDVDIFFDGIPVHGDAALGETVFDYAYERGANAPDFLKLLTEPLRDWRAPLTLFGGIRTKASGRVDLKLGGLMPISTNARVLAIKHNVRARSTPERLRGLIAKGIGAPAEMERIIEAHRVILGAILGQQLADSESGIPLSSNVDPERLGKDGRAALKLALAQIDPIIDLAREGRV